MLPERIWKILRQYIAFHELLCIFGLSVTVFLGVFWFIYTSMVTANVEAIHRLDFYSMHCGLISERLAKEIDDLNLMKEKLSYEVALLEGKRNNDLATYKQVQAEMIKIKKEKVVLSNEMAVLTNSFQRLQNEMIYSSKELSISKAHITIESSELVRKTNKDTLTLDQMLDHKSYSCCQACLFSFYLIKPKLMPDDKMHRDFIYALEGSKYRVLDPTSACLVISTGNSKNLDSLENVNHYNRVHFVPSFERITAHSFPHFSLVGHEIVNRRISFDLVIPILTLTNNLSDESSFKKLSPFVPLKRYILVSFESSLPLNYSSQYSELSKQLSRAVAGNKIVLRFKSKQSNEKDLNYTDLTGTLNSRISLLSNSTFALVVGSSVSSMQARLIESLSQSTVPIVLSSDVKVLPFYEFIDWSLAAVVIAEEQIPNLSNILSSLSDNDLMALKKQCRDIYMMYFFNTEAVVNASLEAWRFRLGLQANAATNYFSPHKKTISHPGLSSNSDYLLNARDSPQYPSNYSFLMNQHKLWNNFPGPFWAYPQDPARALLPSEAKFKGSEKGFRPINFGKGGDGKYFKLALGGDIEAESFTILILTYKREQMLMQMIKDFDKLPNLHSVIVVWNAPGNVSHNLVWPSISAPIHVVKGPKNSLNNRFLPYDEIKTEAVLSLDDDMVLTHEEIVLTFRVWRENRDRIVGIPARVHSWDSDSLSWTYNNFLTCEISLVLTGAAFVHKYYFYLYTYSMPSVIRDRVDEYMNCEDIALNFLVSHITRKPPIKATAKRTFLCQQCGEDSLWIDPSHIRERNECLNFFAEVYGYMPLLSTQFRADSVLYKNVIPEQDLETCFDKV